MVLMNSCDMEEFLDDSDPTFLFLKERISHYCTIPSQFLEYPSKPAINSLFTSGWGGRAVEGTGLENRRAGNCTVGSNPTPTVIQYFAILAACRIDRVSQISRQGDSIHDRTREGWPSG